MAAIGGVVWVLAGYRSVQSPEKGVPTLLTPSLYSETPKTQGTGPQARPLCSPRCGATVAVRSSPFGHSCHLDTFQVWALRCDSIPDELPQTPEETLCKWDQTPHISYFLPQTPSRHPE